MCIYRGITDWVIRDNAERSARTTWTISVRTVPSTVLVLLGHSPESGMAVASRAVSLALAT